jgi:hypothetical protein
MVVMSKRLDSYYGINNNNIKNSGNSITGSSNYKNGEKRISESRLNSEPPVLETGARWSVTILSDHASITQLVECLFCKQVVKDSIPFAGSKILRSREMASH